MAEQLDPQAKAVHDGMEHLFQLRAERDKLTAMCNNWERAHTMLQSENEMMKRRIAALESEKGFYQRFSSELVAHVGDIGRLAETVLTKSRHGAYRPSGAAPREQGPPADGTERDDGQEVPKFLTEHAERPSDGLERDIAQIAAPRTHPVAGFDPDRTQY